MTDETQTAPPPATDDGGRVRTPMSPATWTADEPRPETQPGVVQTEPETKPEPTPEPPAPKPKKAA
jgi:hypothetical protein